MRVKPGMYYIIPYEQDAATFMPQWHSLASYLAQGKEYYIGYHSGTTHPWYGHTAHA
ncbi:MAG: hypothetical protein AAFU83_00690 [Bacteroidota bacterium]